MNLNQVFDTLVYGKGTAKRGNYYFVNGVHHEGNIKLKGLTREVISSTYTVTFKGYTVLIIREIGIRNRNNYHVELIYRISNKSIEYYNINPLINKTLNRVTSYLIDSYDTYKKLYINN